MKFRWRSRIVIQLDHRVTYEVCRVASEVSKACRVADEICKVCTVAEEVCKVFRVADLVCKVCRVADEVCKVCRVAGEVWMSMGVKQGQKRTGCWMARLDAAANPAKWGRQKLAYDGTREQRYKLVVT